MTECMAGSGKPRSGLYGPAIQPDADGFPEMLPGMRKIQDAAGIKSKLIGICAPKAASAITQPHGDTGLEDPFFHSRQPQAGLKFVDGPQNGNQTPLSQNRHGASDPGHALSHTGHNRHLDFPPDIFPLSASGLRAKGHHHAIASEHQGSCAMVALA